MQGKAAIFIVFFQNAKAVATVLACGFQRFMLSVQ